MPKSLLCCLFIVSCTALRPRAAGQQPKAEPAIHAGPEGRAAAVGEAGAATPGDPGPLWHPTDLPNARVYTSTAGLTLSHPMSTKWIWQQAGQAASWHPRDGAGLVWFAGKLWLLGGWYNPGVAEWGDAVTTNEVWSSDDLGETWVQRLPHDSTAPSSGPMARWAPRHTAGWLTHTHEGIPYLYVIGGDIYHVSSDTWRSRDGITWEQVSSDAPWQGRVLQMAGSYAGDLYVMGGQTDIADQTTALNDVWKSSDGGVTWQQLPDAPWSPRGMAYNLVEWQGALWLCGGGTYLNEGARTFFNDVWRFDGTWTEVSGDGVAPWAAREYHNVFTFAGELWVSSGYGADNLNHNDFWHTADGTTWSAIPTPPFQPGHADGIAVAGDTLVHASGNAMDSYTFRTTTAQAAPVARWADQGAASIDLQQSDSAAQPLVVRGAFGQVDGVLFDGLDAFMRLDARDMQPEGVSVFWLARAGRAVEPVDSVNPNMTIVGDSDGGCRHQAGYSGNQAELVVTDEAGAWSGGHVLRGANVTDNQTHLIGFTHALDGTVRASIDGAPSGEPVVLPYDAPNIGWDLLGAGFSTGNRAAALLGFVVVVPSVIDDEDVARLMEFSRGWR